MKQDSKPVMSNTVDKHTPGPWDMKAAKWTNDAAEPIGGFSIQAGDKKICGFNVVTDSRILPDEYFKNWPEHHKEHFTVEEAEANAALIASAPQLKKENEELKERNRVLVEALKEMIEEAKGAIFVFGNENNYPEGTKGYRIKTRLAGASKNGIKAIQSNQ